MGLVLPCLFVAPMDSVLCQFQYRPERCPCHPLCLGAVRTNWEGERLDKTGRGGLATIPYSKVMVVMNGGSGSLFDSDQAIVVRTAITATIHTVLRPNRSAMSQLLTRHA